MSPDGDWALGQNEVDVRNEARRARHYALKLDYGKTTERIVLFSTQQERLEAALRELRSPSVFVCHDPEQAWIDDQAENAAQVEREDT